MLVDNLSSLLFNSNKLPPFRVECLADITSSVDFFPFNKVLLFLNLFEKNSSKLKYFNIFSIFPSNCLGLKNICEETELSASSSLCDWDIYVSSFYSIDITPILILFVIDESSPSKTLIIRGISELNSSENGDINFKSL